MHRRYFGDSYDAVKRLWQQVLGPWAPLHANVDFIPIDLQKDFTRLTGIPMVHESITLPHSVLNDPNTGIRLPGRADQSEGMHHVSLRTVVTQLRQPHVVCVVTFDQSNYRTAGTLRSQRLRKVDELAAQGIHSFYYASHASFLFAMRTHMDLQKVTMLLREAGIPQERLEFAGAA
jgi:hypothetical protein